MATAKTTKEVRNAIRAAARTTGVALGASWTDYPAWGQSYDYKCKKRYVTFEAADGDLDALVREANRLLGENNVRVSEGGWLKATGYIA